MFGFHAMGGAPMSFVITLPEPDVPIPLAWSLDSRTTTWALVARDTGWNVPSRPTDWTL